MLNRTIPYPSLLVHRTSRGVAGYEGLATGILRGWYVDGGGAAGLELKRCAAPMRLVARLGYMLDGHDIRLQRWWGGNYGFIEPHPECP